MIYFISDTHFNHTNIAGPKVSRWSSGYRDFDSVGEMNEAIFDSINSVVGEDDVLYHLGDFAFGDKRKIPELRARIRCKTIHLIFGNHDHSIKKHYRNLFTSCSYTMDELFLHSGDKRYHFHLLHYPVESWNGIGRGCIHLHGHIHSTEQRGKGKKLDVGYDAFRGPTSLDKIVELANERDVYVPEFDHHGANTPIR